MDVATVNIDHAVAVKKKCIAMPWVCQFIQLTAVVCSTRALLASYGLRYKRHLLRINFAIPSEQTHAEQEERFDLSLLLRTDRRHWSRHGRRSTRRRWRRGNCPAKRSWRYV